MVECEFATRNSRVASADGFNRYMVECEFGFGGIPVKASRVLIDTWWNVNYINIGGVTDQTYVLIDTWWNVNEMAYL